MRYWEKCVSDQVQISVQEAPLGDEGAGYTPYRTKVSYHSVQVQHT